MRKVAIKLILFFAVVEGLGRVDFMVLLAAMGVALAVVIWSDLLLDSPAAK